MKGEAKTMFCKHCGWCFPWHACKVREMTPEVELACLRALDGCTRTTPARVLYRAEYNGVFTWLTPDGWTIGVFNDCAEWDYVQFVTSPSGVTYDFPFVGGYAQDDPEADVMTEWVARWNPLLENADGWPNHDDLGPEWRKRGDLVDGRPYPLEVAA